MRHYFSVLVFVLCVFAHMPAFAQQLLPVGDDAELPSELNQGYTHSLNPYEIDGIEGIDTRVWSMDKPARFKAGAAHGVGTFRFRSHITTDIDGRYPISSFGNLEKDKPLSLQDEEMLLINYWDKTVLE